jgi:hypothetical protein
MGEETLFADLNSLAFLQLDVLDRWLCGDLNNRRELVVEKRNGARRGTTSMANAHQSEPDFKVVVEKDQMMRTRDGMCLRADVSSRCTGTFPGLAGAHALRQGCRDGADGERLLSPAR